MDLSIILTAHDEGLVAHKTLLSIFKALELVPDCSYEILVHLDCADEETRKYFNRYKGDKRFRLFENNFGDLGLSRNFAIKNARGKFLFILDSDDLVSYNILKIAMDCARDDGASLYHPELVLTFGECSWLGVREDSESRELGAYKLLSLNAWQSMVFGRRKIFLRYPYKATKNGIGYEDWIFNTDTMNDGINHKVLRGGILFYRRKKNSLLTRSFANAVMQPYSALFDLKEFAKNRYINPIDNRKNNGCSKNSRGKDTAILFYKRLRSNRLLNYFITPVASLAKRVVGKKLVEPQCARFYTKEFIDCYERINLIENQLFPYRKVLDNLSFAPLTYTVSDCYGELASHVKDYPDIVFIVPWIVSGGADKVLFNYISALSSLKKNIKITVITTLKYEHNKNIKLPENVSVLDFGIVSDSLVDVFEKDILFSRIITQLKCSRIHIINSSYAYEWVQRHMDYVHNNIYLTASYFFYELIESTDFKAKCSFADPLLISIHPVLRGIFTDNSVIINSSVLSDGFEKDLFKVHYQPIAIRDKTPIAEDNIIDNKIHILWAGRICSAKNPTLLVEIAKALDDGYQIDVYGRFDGVSRNIFKGVPNIRYMGEFSDFYSINTLNYDMLLYTSRTDGVPNVILEAASCNLPVIASDAGGISDVIHKGTGILVKDFLNANAYVKEIIKLSKDPKKAKGLANGAMKLLSERHSWDNFIKTVEKDFVIDPKIPCA